MVGMSQSQLRSSRPVSNGASGGCGWVGRRGEPGDRQHERECGGHPPPPGGAVALCGCRHDHTVEGVAYMRIQSTSCRAGRINTPVCGNMSIWAPPLLLLK
jgi:hypothetical protein